MPNLKPLAQHLSANAGLATAWANFGTLHTRIVTELAGIAPNFSFVIRGDVSDRFVGSAPVADIKRKFEAISWELVDASFGNGGVGEVKSFWKDGMFRKKWLRAEQKTNATQFSAYAALPSETGLIYLALHETAHVSDLGLDVGNQCWNMFLQTGRPHAAYANSDLWTYNEAVANGLVRAICAKLGWTMMNNPGGGYVQ